MDGWREVGGWNVLETVEGREETKEKREDRREKGEGRRMGKTKNEAAKILTTDY